MRLLTIISGAMLIMTSLFCYANPGETFLPLAFVLGMAMILTGIIQCVAYWWGRDDRQDNNGWIFAEAITTLILGILVLTSLIAADAAIPMVFGLWVMFSGILRFVVATMINPKTKRANFVWTMSTGVLSIGCGLYAFLNPYIANLSIAVLLGFLFMIQGICTLELGIHMPHEKKEKVKKPKAKAIRIQIKKPVKKKADKNKAVIGNISNMDFNANDLDEIDVKKFMTEEIRLDDIKAALEFNMSESEQDGAVTESTADEIPETKENQISVDEQLEPVEQPELSTEENNN